ncbi:MAG: hypothetical protein ACFB10_21525 [Salibacteraceae bacterium]
MTKELSAATKELYQAFEKYPFRLTTGSPLTVSEKDKAILHSKPLRLLGDEELSRYAFKAMTTWGELNDFKHYLPRIFELAATRELGVATFVVLGKLDHGEWKTWEPVEQETITNFLKAWWSYDINCAPYFDAENFVEIHKKTNDLDGMLQQWDLHVASQGFRNYVDFLAVHYQELKGRNKFFKSLKKTEIETLLQWTVAHAHKLEEGFFWYDQKEEAFSKTISDTLYMFERV